MDDLTCLGTGASKLSKTGTKQAAREEESPQKHIPMIALTRVETMVGQ